MFEAQNSIKAAIAIGFSDRARQKKKISIKKAVIFG
jgi:hypothetical protein